MSDSVAYVFIAMFAVYGFYMALYEIRSLAVKLYLRKKANNDIDKHGKI